ncbi:MAG: hypothetical protein A2W26_11785 [Acidobacteria bacterium RBG_16_64_8]|nr:MAG: hypothetical protein A2W26_11785 [Acidobacteria bacterium RBG_16_64_8]
MSAAVLFKPEAPGGLTDGGACDSPSSRSPRLLATTLLGPDRWWYLSDLAKRLGVGPSSLQRELASLVGAGILSRKRESNRVYYKANEESPLLPELRGLAAKTSGLAVVLRDALAGLVRRIMVAFVYGPMARAEERPGSEVDLLIVGKISLSDLSPRLRRAEAQLGREVNVTAFGPEEFAAKAGSGNHFLRAVLRREKMFVVGDQRDLEDTLHPRAD